jgi:hypothetical protein
MARFRPPWGTRGERAGSGRRALVQGRSRDRAVGGARSAHTRARRGGLGAALRGYVR